MWTQNPNDFFRAYIWNKLIYFAINVSKPGMYTICIERILRKDYRRGHVKILKRLSLSLNAEI